jgi:hypothetical protein
MYERETNDNSAREIDFETVHFLFPEKTTKHSERMV